MGLVKFLIILSLVICPGFILNDSPKRGMSRGWGLIGLLGLIGLVIYLIVRKPILTHLNTSQKHMPDESTFAQQNKSQNLIIPDICPHCKNPNTKKIRLCEWCGSQIIL
jgi:hypothetical protein